jgi:hypothetical protein
MTRHIQWKTLTATILSVPVLCFVILSVQADADWSPPLNLSASAVHTEGASIAVDTSSRIHVVWSEGGEILHRFRDATGWSAAAYVASGTSPHLAADAAGGVHLVFANRFAGIDDIYFTSWQAISGWDLPLNLSEGVGFSFSPRLAIAPDHGFAVVWSVQSGDSQFVYVARSADGLPWSMSPVPNAHGAHPVVGFSPAEDLLVAWQEPYDEVGSPTEVFVSQQTGSQWTLPVDVSASPEVDSRLPSLAVGPGGVYVAWQEAGPEGQAVYWSRMTDREWATPQKRSGSGQAFAPAMASDASGHGHMVWTTESAVQYVTWSPLTGIWEPIGDVTVGQVGPSQACIVLEGSPHVLWLAEASRDNDDVYYSRRAAVEPSPTPSATPTATATPTLGPSWSVFLPCILVGSQPMP